MTDIIHLRLFHVIKCLVRTIQPSGWKWSGTFNKTFIVKVWSYATVHINIIILSLILHKMHTSSRKINVTCIFSLKSRRNTYLHPLIKFLLPNTLPFGKTWWAPSQNLSRNTKTGFIKSQSKQVCLSCCIKNTILSTYGISTPMPNPYIHTDLYVLVSPSIKRDGRPR